jgi:biopolymer transport protein ExbB
MDLTQKLLAFTLLGTQWVLWLLIALSVLSIAIMIERFLYLVSRRVDLDRLMRDVREGLRAGDAEGIAKRYAGSEAIEAVVAVTGLREASRGAAATAEAMAAARSRQRQLMERHLAVLGTLGNNAPFIGLFGTVLGIIRAFHDLKENAQSGADAVMGGISEALVATAVGLLVAIPAVMAFNYFNRRVRFGVARSDQVAHAILTELRAEGDPETKSEAA